MNDFIKGILEMMLIANLMIVMVGGISRLIGSGIGYRWRKMLWLVLALRLMIPFNISFDQLDVALSKYMIEVEVPVSSRIDKIVTGQGETFYAQTLQSGNDDKYASESDNVIQVQEEQQLEELPEREQLMEQEPVVRDNYFDIEQICLVCWVAVIGLLFCYRIFQYQCVRKKLRSGSKLCDYLNAHPITERICAEYGVRLHVPLMVNQGIHSPMLFGIKSPVVYLPDRVYDDTELEMIIRHELTHLKSRDLGYKWLILAVCDIYWFNPILRLMKKMAYQDIEYVCDEKVTGGLDVDGKAHYGETMLHTTNQHRSRDPLYNTQFTGGRKMLKKRIHHIFSKPKIGYGYALLAILLIGLLAGFLMVNITSANATQKSEKEPEHVDSDTHTEVVEKSQSDVKAETEISEMAGSFAVVSLDDVFLGEAFALEKYYITRKECWRNIYWIDDQQVLWGCGINQFGQLGNGEVDQEITTDYSNVTKIAEDVISVDCGWNGYFCIYLTASGELYGMGSNLIDLLGQKETEMVYSESDYIKVTTPVLLMEDVSYARAGRYSIVALKKDGSAWWWGEYKPVDSTKYYPPNLNYFWKMEEDEANPSKMMYTSPVKMLDDCIYVATGDYVGAAITEKGELYTWGSNIYGQCGVTVSDEDDFVRKPQKVLENVKMVWLQNILFNSPKGIGDCLYEVDHIYNTFAELTNGTIVACGKNIGEKTKTTDVTGDLVETHSHIYSDVFLPVELVEYQEEDKEQEVFVGVDVVE